VPIHPMQARYQATLHPADVEAICRLFLQAESAQASRLHVRWLVEADEKGRVQLQPATGQAVRKVPPFETNRSPPTRRVLYVGATPAKDLLVMAVPRPWIAMLQ